MVVVDSDLRNVTSKVVEDEANNTDLHNGYRNRG